MAVHGAQNVKRSDEITEAEIPDDGMEHFARLLLEHETLIRQTTEDAVTQLTFGLADLHALLLDVKNQYPDRAELDSAIKTCLQLQMTMQFHDIVRQQFDAICVGLKSLAEACPPDEDGWLARQITKLESAYVMQDQWNLHDAHFGRQVTVIEDEDVMLF